MPSVKSVPAAEVLRSNSACPRVNPRRQAEEEKELNLPEVLFKTIQHFVPEFFPALSRISDPRDPNRIIYPIQEFFLVGVLSFMFKIRSRRNIKYKLGTPKFIKNLQCISDVFYPKDPFADTLLHGDTLNKLMNRIPVKYSHELRTLILRSLIRNRCLEKWRILSGYAIVIDGTGMIVYRKRHCKHCLTRKLADGNTSYYHPVLEAKLVCPGLGLALSIGTEFIENLSEYSDKQDCELKAFQRLLPKLRKDFPQTSICLLLDALYANERVFKLCQEQRCSYLITFKKGSMPAAWEEFQALKKLNKNQQLELIHDKKTQRFSWINDIAYKGRRLNAIEMTETKEGEQSFYGAWLASWFVTRDNVNALVLGGRARWMIENEGFNMQKNGGYKLEHAFSNGSVAMKHFYILLQIAHIFNQLMEKGSLLRKKIRQTMGSLQVFTERLWALMTEMLINKKHLRAILAKRIQIRFDSS
jgi:hypothetical protein